MASERGNFSSTYVDPGSRTGDRAPLARLIENKLVPATVAIVSIVYFGFLGAYYFAHEQVVSFVGSLGLWDVERVAAKAGNLLFGMTFIYFVCLSAAIFNFVVRRQTGKDILVSAFLGEKWTDASSAWWIRLCQANIGIGLLLVVAYFAHSRIGMPWLFLEDGPVEYFTALGFLVVGIQLIIVAIAYKKLMTSQGHSNRLAYYGILMMGLMSILVFFEEISWSQRIIGYETPEALTYVNTQDEANLHNLFTDYFNQTYFWVGCIFLVANFVLIQLRLKHPQSTWALLLPHPYLLPLAVLITSFSFHIEANELVEPLAVLYMVLYTIQLQANVKRGAVEEVAVLRPAGSRD